MTMERPYIHYGEHRIPFELHPKKSTSSRITIKVNTHGQVLVSAPPHLPHTAVFHAVNQRAKWIYEKWQWFSTQQKQQPVLQYTSGERHGYLGEQYVLQVTESAHACISVCALSRKLHIALQEAGQQEVRLALQHWYQQQARVLFNQRLDELLPLTPWVKNRPTLGLRFMKSRWGSCSVQGKISLNIHLIKAPLCCIDYVILHELCHIAEHNHSVRFYQLMAQVSPDWKRIKALLDEKTSQYLT